MPADTASPELPQIVIPDYCAWSDREKALFLEDILTNTIPGLDRELSHRFYDGELRHWVRLTLPPLIPPGTVLADLANLLNVDRAALSNAVNHGEISFALFLALLRLLNIRFDELPHHPRDLASVVDGIAEAISRAASRLHLFATPGSRLADIPEKVLPRGDRALLGALVCDTERQEHWITTVTACRGDLSEALANPEYEALLNDILSAAVRIASPDDQASAELLRWAQPDLDHRSFAVHLVRLWNTFYMPTEIAREVVRSLLLDAFEK